MRPTPADDAGRPRYGRYPAIWVSGVICPLGPTFGHIHGPFCRAPPVKKIFCAGRRHLSSARRRRRKIWRAKRWGHFCMEKVECPRTSAVPPPAVLPHVTYRCPTQVHMWPPIERRAYVPSRPSTQVPFTVLLKAWIRIVRYLDIRVTTPSG